MSALVSLWLQDYSWYIGILCRFCMGDWSEAEPGESFWWVSRQGGHRSSSNILIDKSLATYKMLSLAFDWTISVAKGDRNVQLIKSPVEVLGTTPSPPGYNPPTIMWINLFDEAWISASPMLHPCFVHVQVSSKLSRALYTFSRSSNAMEQGVFEIASEWPDTPMHL